MLSDQIAARLLPTRFLRALCVVYLLLIVYCSLLPWHGWRPSTASPLIFLLQPIHLPVPRRSVAENILAYVPLGLLLIVSGKRSGAVWPITLVTIAGGALSVGIESLQGLLPTRDASNLDVLANTMGTLVGAGAGVLFSRGTPVRSTLNALRRDFQPGPIINVGLSAAFLWVLGQWMPLIPVLSLTELRANVLPAVLLVQGTYDWRFTTIAAYTFDIAALLLLITLLGRNGRPGLLASGLAAAMVFLVQPLLHGHQFSPEVWGGLATGLILAVAITGKPSRTLAVVLFLLAGIVAHNIEPHGVRYGAVSWIPFHHYTRAPLNRFGDMLMVTWPFLALGCLAVISSSTKHVRRTAVTGGFGVLTFVAVLEFVSHRVSGTYGDVTNVLLAVAGWTVPWLLQWEHSNIVLGD